MTIELRIVENSDTSDKHASVSFTGPDGRVVSLAFDGRFDRYDYIGRGDGKVYQVYADCPVIDADGNQHTQFNGCDGRNALRILRDSLNELDLEVCDG